MARLFTGRIVAFCCFAVASAAFTAQAVPAGITYPATNRGDTIDDYHGTKVPDPYRWLEADPRSSAEVAAWIAAQNGVTRPYLDAVTEREAIRGRLTRLWNYERFTLPVTIGNRSYYGHNDGLQNQDVIYADAGRGEAQVVLDPNEWSADGSEILSSIEPSPDGRYLAYGRSSGGSDWNTWYVKDLVSGQDLPDRIEWTKLSLPAWSLDGSGFFYARFDAPTEGQERRESERGGRICWHRVGDPQSADRVVFEQPDHPEWMFAVRAGEESHYLLIYGFAGHNARLWAIDLASSSPTVFDVVPNVDSEWIGAGLDGSTLFLRTNYRAANSRVVAIDLARPDSTQWREVIPETDLELAHVSLVGSQLFARYVKDATSWVRTYSLEGKLLHDVELPGLGTVAGFDGSKTDTVTYYAYTSFNSPAALYRYDIATGRSTPWHLPNIDADLGAIETKQVFYRSKDGTKVPMFIVHHRDVEPNGALPTRLFGYGGFSRSVSPIYQAADVAWFEMGGLFAVANIRGGGEYGDEWHRAGSGVNKQNGIDDFIAAAEYLIAEKYTDAAHLSIQGGSNGGLLVGAALTQRPDLFRAVVATSGLLDMLRYQNFTHAKSWINEYGSAEDSTQFSSLFRYSPLHNVRPNTAYPATLIMTSDSDDRVVPAHSFKFAAALQAAQVGDAPILLRVDTNAGHASRQATDKQIEQAADRLAFLVRVLDMKLPPKFAARTEH